MSTDEKTEIRFSPDAECSYDEDADEYIVEEDEYIVVIPGELFEDMNDSMVQSWLVDSGAVAKADHDCERDDCLHTLVFGPRKNTPAPILFRV